MKQPILLALALASFTCTPLLANFNYTYTTTGLGTSGSAQFVLTGTTLQVTVTNLNVLSGNVGPVKLIHGVRFAPSAGGLTTTLNPTAVNYAMTAGVNSWDCTTASNTCLVNSALALPGTAEWKLSAEPSYYQVDDLAGSFKPGIGNASILNSIPNGGLQTPDKFNPVLNAATFTFTVNNAFSMAQASSVGVLFGTSGDVTSSSIFNSNDPSPVPEPTFYGVLSAGLVGLVLLHRRQRSV